MSNNEDVEVYCDVSDEEYYSGILEKTDDGTWQPKPQDLLNMFQKLEKQPALELAWENPGRRPIPSSPGEESDGDHSEEKE